MYFFCSPKASEGIFLFHFITLIGLIAMAIFHRMVGDNHLQGKGLMDSRQVVHLNNVPLLNFRECYLC